MMNKRIRELYNQSLVVRNDDAQWIESELDPEKFAELIVLECQDRVEHYIRDCGEIGSLPDTVIKKHFGVEE